MILIEWTTGKKGVAMTEKEEFEYLLKTMRLSNKEAENAARFIKKHIECKTLSQSLGNITYVISFHQGSIGSFVKIQCEKCHKEKDISDDVRSNW